MPPYYRWIARKSDYVCPNCRFLNHPSWGCQCPNCDFEYSNDPHYHAQLALEHRLNIRGAIFVGVVALIAIPFGPLGLIYGVPIAGAAWLSGAGYRS